MLAPNEEHADGLLEDASQLALPQKDGKAPDQEDASQLSDPSQGGFLQEIVVLARPGWRAIALRGLCLQEVSGALGDLGTFLALTTFLAAKGRISGPRWSELASST